MLGDKTAFLNQYAIPEKMYEEAGMSWADLEAMYSCIRAAAR